MKHTRLKWSLGLAAVGLLVLLWVGRPSTEGTASAELAALRRMGHPTSWAEMNARLPSIPASENAGPALQATLGRMSSDGFDEALSKVFDSGRDPVVPWSEAERTAAEAVTATNAAAFAVLHAVLQRPRLLLVPNLVPGGAPDGPSAFDFIQAERLLALRTGCASRGQRSAEAAESIGDALALARCLGAPPNLVAAIFHQAVFGITLTSLEGALHHARFTDPELRGLQTALDRGWTTDLAERAIVAELCYARALSETPGTVFRDTVLSKGPPGSLRELADGLYVQFFAAAGLQRQDFPFYARRMVRYLEIVRGDPAQRERLLTTAQAETQRWIQDHYWRTRFSAAVMPRFFSALEQDPQNQVRNRAAHAALAIERYRLEHDDELPPTLDVLVPGFLNRVPQDIYAAAPLRFRKLDRSYVLYSVGRDLKDDGGPISTSDNAPDITFRVTR